MNLFFNSSSSSRTISATGINDKIKKPKLSKRFANVFSETFSYFHFDLKSYLFCVLSLHLVMSCTVILLYFTILTVVFLFICSCFMLIIS